MGPTKPSGRARPNPGRAAAGLLLLAGWAAPGAAQPASLSPIRESGQSVTPAFEGWYRNPDGTYSLSFGYLNRNAREVLEIPVGRSNFIRPGGPDRGQPTRFEPRRHWGVFVVTVPASFGDTAKVIWTLVIRGDSVAIPGSLKPGWEIDALQGEAGSGNTPPALRFAADGPEGRGPGGLWGQPLSAAVGRPLPLSVWANDDGKAIRSIASDGRPGVPVNLTWFKHQGPPDGAVHFSEAKPPLDPQSGKATTSVTFTLPGDYILRVRANDASGVANAGHAQCCWTNGFVKVRVSP